MRWRNWDVKFFFWDAKEWSWEMGDKKWEEKGIRWETRVRNREMNNTFLDMKVRNCGIKTELKDERLALMGIEVSIFVWT